MGNYAPLVRHFLQRKAQNERRGNEPEPLEGHLDALLEEACAYWFGEGHLVNFREVVSLFIEAALVMRQTTRISAERQANEADMEAME